MPYKLPEDEKYDNKYSRPLRYKPEEWAEMIKRIVKNEWKSWDEFNTHEGSTPDFGDFKYPNEPVLTITYSSDGLRAEWWTATYNGALQSNIGYGTGTTMGHPCDEYIINIELLRRNPPISVTM